MAVPTVAMAESSSTRNTFMQVNYRMQTNIIEALARQFRDYKLHYSLP